MPGLAGALHPLRASAVPLRATRTQSVARHAGVAPGQPRRGTPCARALAWRTPEQVKHAWFHEVQPASEVALASLRQRRPCALLPARLDALLRDVESAAAAAQHLALHHEDAALRAAGLEVARSAQHFLTYVWQDQGIRSSIASCRHLPQAQDGPGRASHIFLAEQLLLLLEAKHVTVAQGAGLLAAQEVRERRDGQLRQQLAHSRRLVSMIKQLLTEQGVSPALQLTPDSVLEAQTTLLHWRTGSQPHAAETRGPLQPDGAGQVGSTQDAGAAGAQLSSLRLTWPVTGRLLQHCPSSSLRRAVYAGGVEQRQRAMLRAYADLAAARQHVAAMMGYTNCPEWSMRRLLGSQPEAVALFLEDLADMVRPFADQFAADVGRACWGADVATERGLHPADVEYGQALLLQQCLGSGQGRKVLGAVRLDGLLQGVAGLLRRSMGLLLKSVDLGDGEGWRAGIRKLQVSCEEVGVLGTLYVEPAAGYGTKVLRYGSWDSAAASGGDEHSAPPQLPTAGGELAPGRAVPAAGDGSAGVDCNGGAYQPAVVAVGLQCGEALGGDGTGILELLHELGHAVHLLAAARQPHLVYSPMYLPLDVDELPSQLFELFATDPRTLRVLLEGAGLGSQDRSMAAAAGSDGGHVLDGMPSDTQSAAAADQAYLEMEEVAGALQDAEVGRLARYLRLCRDTPLTQQAAVVAALADLMSGLEASQGGSAAPPAWTWGDANRKFGSLPGTAASLHQVAMLPVIATKQYTYSGYVTASLLAYATWQRHFQEDPLDPVAGRTWRHCFLQPGASVSPAGLVQGALGEASLCSSGPACWLPSVDGKFVQGWLGQTSDGCITML